MSIDLTANINSNNTIELSVVFGASFNIDFDNVAHDIDLGTYGITSSFYDWNTTPQGRTLTAGQSEWSETEGTVILGMNGGDVMQSIGLEQYYRVKASEAITNGQVVMFDGAQGNSGVILAKPKVAGSDGKLIIGIATEDIALNGLGFVTWQGKLQDFDTTGDNVSEEWSDGDLLYEHPTLDGEMTNVEPDVGNKSPIAAVLNSNVTGQIIVRVQRTLGINHLNNVNISNPQDGDVLKYNATGQYWYNTTI